ncbi:Potassium efflux system KefA protein / Small-conductance mechanosensitive channel [Minicystis rosea]|nr:Potassium efflux system KefA protein / Small-conductance mechanosensitive channel [Minicystis rosea]
MRAIVLPPLDLLAHNLAAVLAAVVLVMVFSQVVSSAIQRASRLFLQASVFDALTDEEREAMRRRVRRRSLIMVALISLALLVAGVAGSFLGVRALDVLRSALGGMGGGDPVLLREGLAGVAGIVAAALVLDVLARAVVATLGKALARSAWFAARREPLLDAVERLRAAARTGIFCGAVVLCARALAVPLWLLRVVTVGAYALAAFHGSRAVTAIAYIVVDLFFDGSGKLTRLESPLRYLGSLTHLTGITKRTIDYFVYVGAATLVADELTPDTWISRAGRVGIRIIIIFYTSRVLVELSILFLKEIFLGKDVEGDEVALQRRQTLVPVAAGFLRYGIYFAALVMVLRAAEIDPTPLLAGAGVIGVAIGLGAQAFVGDIVAGFFILFEDLILVGDLIEVGSVKGRVEEMGVRLTKIRNDAGVLHAIPNGEVRKVANHSKAYVNAVVDVHVPYEEDLRAVRALLQSVAEKAHLEETGKPSAVEVKVQELHEGAIVLRVSARVAPGKDEDLSDVIRARIAEELRDAGVGAPRPRRAVIIDSALRVGAPLANDKEKGGKEEESGPPKPFEAPKAE